MISMLDASLDAETERALMEWLVSVGTRWVTTDEILYGMGISNRCAWQLLVRGWVIGNGEQNPQLSKWCISQKGLDRLNETTHKQI